MKPNRENIISEILIELNKGTTFEECFKLIQTKSNLVRSTFSTYWKDANSRYAVTQQQAQEAMRKANVSQTVKAVESGLKSKIERQLELQNDIIELQKLLLAGECEDTFISKSEVPKKYMRKLQPSEIANYKKTIIQIQKELSLMSGEYAAIKQETAITVHPTTIEL